MQLYFFQFTYKRNDDDDRMYYACFMKVKGLKEAQEKASRCMSEFKEPKLVALRFEKYL